MLRIIFITGLCIQPYFCFSQQKTLDSLYALLNQHPQEDTVRLNLLNEISYAYSSNDPGKGLAIAEEGILLAKKLKDNKKLASAYSNKGVNFWARGEDSLASLFFTDALHVHQADQNEKGIAIAYNNLGLLAFNGGDYIKALEYHFRCLEFFEKLKDSSRLPDIYANIGVDYQYLSDYSKALDYYFKGLEIAERKNNVRSVAIISGNIGLVYKNFGSYPQALPYQEKALALYEQTGNKQGIASTLGNIGVLYDLMENMDTALLFFQKALSLNREIGNKRRIASDLSNIGVVQKNRNEFALAIKNLQKSLQINMELNDRENMAIVWNQLGSVYVLARPNDLKGLWNGSIDRFSKAVDFQNRALNVFKELRSVKLQSEVWSALAETYKAMGESEKALEAYQNYMVLKDSITGSEQREYALKKAMQFEFEKRADSLRLVNDRAVALETAEVNRQKIIRSSVSWGAAFLFLGGIIIFILYKRKKDAQQQQKEAELKAEVSNTEMKALRAQMNPHFIFNSLNSISDYILKNEHEEANQYLIKFSKLIRKTLEHSEKKLITLREDLDTLNLYLQLESKRLKGKFNFNISVGENIDRDNTLIPPLILQPFVENSIWHGIAGKKGQGHIEISILRKGEMLHCLIDDDGIGRDAASRLTEKSKTSSMGMKITKTRIDLLNKLQKSKGTVEVLDLANGMRVQVNLPLELSF